MGTMYMNIRLKFQVYQGRLCINQIPRRQKRGEDPHGVDKWARSDLHRFCMIDRATEV